MDSTFRHRVLRIDAPWRRTATRAATWLLLGGLALGASACRVEREPATNARGPSLRIIQPREGRRFPVTDDLRGLGRVEVLFDLDDVGGSHRIRFRIGGDVPTEVRDPHRRLVRKVPRGTHVLEAWLLDADGRPVEAPGAKAAVTIHVGGSPGAAAGD
jgi:hypothetical protein